MILTENILTAKSKGQAYPHIKQINLCGMHLSDVSIMQNLHQLEVAVLSVNDLTTLVDFEKLESLCELHVRKNEIADITEIKYLQNLPKLQVLSLKDNPCIANAGRDYRLHVIHTLPNLKILDNIEISQTERSNAKDPKYEIVGNVTPQMRPRKPDLKIKKDSRYQDNRDDEIVQKQSRSFYGRNAEFDEKPDQSAVRRPDNLDDPPHDHAVNFESQPLNNALEEKQTVLQRDERKLYDFNDISEYPGKHSNYDERVVLLKKPNHYDEKSIYSRRLYEYSEQQSVPFRQPPIDEKITSPQKKFQNYDETLRNSSLKQTRSFNENPNILMKRRNGHDGPGYDYRAHYLSEDRGRFEARKNNHFHNDRYRQSSSNLRYMEYEDTHRQYDADYDELPIEREVDNTAHFRLIHPRTGKNIQSFNLDSEGTCALAACMCLVERLELKELRQLHRRISYKIDSFSSQ